MPAKRKRALGRTQSSRRTTPVYMMVATIYDPGNRQQNVRLVIEGPFTEVKAANTVLCALVRNQQFSVVGSTIVRISSTEAFYAAIDSIRKVIP